MSGVVMCTHRLRQETESPPDEKVDPNALAPGLSDDNDARAAVPFV